MTIVSNKDFIANQDKYFDLALNEQIFIQRGQNMFIVARANAPKRKFKKPDKDLQRAITGDELLAGINEDLKLFFANATSVTTT